MYKIDYTNVNMGIKYHLKKIIFALCWIIGPYVFLSIFRNVRSNSPTAVVLYWVSCFNIFYLLYQLKLISAYLMTRTCIKKALENNATLVKGVKAKVYKTKETKTQYGYCELEIPYIEYDEMCTTDLVSEPKIGNFDDLDDEAYVDVIITHDAKYYYIDFNIEVQE